MANNPSCVDCKYFQSQNISTQMNYSGGCMVIDCHSPKAMLVSPLWIERQIGFMRGEAYCGTEGRWFEPKEK